MCNQNSKIREAELGIEIIELVVEAQNDLQIWCIHV